MKKAKVVLERAQNIGCLAQEHIIAVQIVGGAFDGAIAKRKARRRAYVSWDKAGAEDDAIRFEQASPQIRKVDGVKRAARRETDGFELRGGQRGGRHRKGEVRRGRGAQGR